ncbi:MAG: aldose epimerase family protein [Planctomycetia bacterium]|jgi:aldose 1-epimerase
MMDREQITETAWGMLPDGTPVGLYTLTNSRGMTAVVSNYGALLTSLIVPDRDGKMQDVVLGYDTLEGYLGDFAHLGAVVGRFGNRIAGGRFTLDGVEYTLAVNNGPNHLHGGIKGFDRVVWQATPRETDDGPAVELTYRSVDGEEGYPGNLDVKITYTLRDENALAVRYEATTDRATPINLTQHSYFNLAGQGEGDILDHVLMIDADAITPVDDTFIPIGEFRPVEGTPFDFRQPTSIGQRVDDETDEQIRLASGYDHNFVLNRKESKKLRLAARVTEPTSGRVMEVLTTEPGVQLYIGGCLGGIVGKGGKTYQPRYAFCLETQHFPDSPNQPNFPSAILRPGEKYDTRTVFRSSID